MSNSVHSWYAVLIGVMAWFNTALAAAPASFPPDAEVRRILAERVDTYHQSTGIVVGLLDGGRSRIISYGSSGRDDGMTLDGDTVFEIGSLTKVFTAFMLADAARRGELKLDDPVQALLPGYRIPQNGRPIALQDLSQHVSGLPREPTGVRSNYETHYSVYTEDQLRNFLAGYTLPRATGDGYEYSNIGAGLLGLALMQKSKLEYADLVRTRVAAPLGLHDTRIITIGKEPSTLATGHNQQLQRVPASPMSKPYAGTGSLWSSTNDMLRFLRAAAGDGPRAQQPAFTMMLATRHAANGAGREAGLGWYIMQTTQGEMAWRNGGTQGFSSWMGFDPATRRGVVVLSNTNSSDGVDDIGRHLLDPEMPLVQTLVDTRKANAARVAIALAPGTVDRYVGQYRLNAQLTLAFRREGERIVAQFTGNPPMEMFAETPTVFFARVAEAQLAFELDREGKTTAVLFHQNGLRARAPLIESPAP